MRLVLLDILLLIAYPLIQASDDDICTLGHNLLEPGEFEDSKTGLLKEWDFFDNGTIERLYECQCNIDKVDLISNEEFLKNYAFQKPVIFVNVNDNSRFRKLCSKKALLENYSSNTITLSTANTHSYEKVRLTLNEYIDRILKPQSEQTLGKDTLYFFGDNNHTEWKDLFDEYEQPPYSLPEKSGAYSFGIAGAGTGVPFHFHGPGFSEVIYGSKRWFLYPYDERPLFDPDQNALRWAMDVYPSLPPKKMPYECTIRPGEVLYFPDMWWHSTLNLKTSVFMSTFLA